MHFDGCVHAIGLVEAAIAVGIPGVGGPPGPVLTARHDRYPGRPVGTPAHGTVQIRGTDVAADGACSQGHGEGREYGNQQCVGGFAIGEDHALRRQRRQDGTVGYEDVDGPVAPGRERTAGIQQVLERNTHGGLRIEVSPVDRPAGLTRGPGQIHFDA